MPSVDVSCLHRFLNSALKRLIGSAEHLQCFWIPPGHGKRRLIEWLRIFTAWWIDSMRNYWLHSWAILRDAKPLRCLLSIQHIATSGFAESLWSLCSWEDKHNKEIWYCTFTQREMTHAEDKAWIQTSQFLRSTSWFCGSDTFLVLVFMLALF